MNFGSPPDYKLLLNLVDKVKIFTEGVNPKESQIELIRSSIQSANKLIYLGFAFYKLNMKLIAPEPNKKKKTNPNIKCFVTIYGISEGDKKMVITQINEIYKEMIFPEVSNEKCNSFFNTFERRLSFENT